MNNMNSLLTLYLARSATSNHLEYEELFALNGYGFIWKGSQGSLKCSDKSTACQQRQSDSSCRSLQKFHFYITSQDMLHIQMSNTSLCLIVSCIHAAGHRGHVSSHHVTEWKLTKALFTPGINMRPGWSPHEWTAVSIEVNAPKTH